MKNTFQNKVVVVTGAAAGIGFATAKEFAEQGAQVVLLDRDEKNGIECEGALKRAGKTATFMKFDVADETKVKSTLAEIVSRFGALDIAVNNAGISQPAVKIHDCEFSDWTKVIDVNVHGTFLCMKYELQHMLPKKSGIIVNMASVMGLVASGIKPAYHTSKHAILGLTKSAAIAYASQGIRVNAICPGFIDTELVDPARKEVLAARSALGRLGTSEEIAKSIIWLCSPDATFVHGTALVVDGGYTIQ